MCVVLGPGDVAEAKIVATCPATSVEVAGPGTITIYLSLSLVLVQRRRRRRMICCHSLPMLPLKMYLEDPFCGDQKFVSPMFFGVTNGHPYDPISQSHTRGRHFSKIRQHRQHEMQLLFVELHPCCRPAVADYCCRIPVSHTFLGVRGEIGRCLRYNTLRRKAL